MPLEGVARYAPTLAVARLPPGKKALFLGEFLVFRDYNIR